MIGYIILYILVLASYFLDIHFAPIVHNIAGTTYRMIPMYIYTNAVYIVITTLVLIRIYLNVVLKNRKAVLIINICCVVISTAIYIFSYYYILPILPPYSGLYVLLSPSFLTFIWIADVFNLVISIILFNRQKKINSGMLTN